MNQFDDISYYYERLVLSFIMFNCNEYSRCCLLHIIHLNYWEENVSELFNKVITNYSMMKNQVKYLYQFSQVKLYQNQFNLM